MHVSLTQDGAYPAHVDFKGILLDAHMWNFTEFQ